MSNKPYILGLDIGTNSIGWAVVDCQVSAEKDKSSPRLSPTGLRAFNSRIFQKMVEAKTEVPKNKQRREARGRRRGLARHKGARLALYELLVKEKLLPEDIDPESPERTFNSIDRDFAERQKSKQWSSEKNLASPFAMRALGLEEPLERYEFGRVLLQLQQRRGYFSNRGAKYVSLFEKLGITEKQEKKEIASDETQQISDVETREKDKAEADEKRKVLGGIIKLRTEMEKLKCRTIGEFVWKKSKIEKLPARRITNYYVETKIEKGRKEGEISRDNLYGNRFLYKKEFELLWRSQEKNLGLSKELKDKVQEIIFYQRPLRIQKNLVGRCSFLIDKPRAAKALLEAQEFRMRTAINHITTQGYDQYEYEPLTPEKRELLYEALNDPEKLNRQGRLSFQKVRKIIGLKPKGKLGSEKLNLEEGEGEDSSAPNDGSFSKSGIVGNLTHKSLLEIIPDQWEAFSEEKKKKLVEDLLTIHDKVALYDRLTNENKPCWTKKDGSPLFAEKKQVLGLACVELEEGYSNHCFKAIKALLPHLRDGKNYRQACEDGGFLENTGQKKEDIEKLEKPPEIANPIVQKALYEIRRLVNSIIREYGKPQEIRVELSREMRASKEQRSKIQSQQKENRKLNEQIEGEIIENYRSGNPNVELGKANSGRSYVPREYREKCKLWKELGEARARCPYSGEPIASFNDMLGAEVDHIIPLSLSNDNSYLNKILCLRSENQEKGQKTPWQAWGSNREKYQGIVERMQKLIKESDQRFQKGLKVKLKKIRLKEIPDDFTQAQLKATQYIAVATRKYLETLSVPIDVTTGRATAELRRLWGLNGLLPKPPEDENTKRPTTEINGEEIMLYTAEKAAEAEAKSRVDHRHHAIDALVVALTDRRIDANLNKRYKYYEEYGNWPDDELALPSLWEEQDVQKNREKIGERIKEVVVSHMANRKIWGALHKESSYGTSWFYDGLKLTANPSKDDKEAIRGNPNDLRDDCCVWDRNVRKVLQDWIENLPKNKKERTLPEYAGQKLEKVTVARRCYVRKIPVKEALKEYIDVDKEWKPGTKVWIQNKNTYNALRDWLLAGNTEKDLANNPPKMKNKNHPEKSNPIESVRTARRFNHASVRGLNGNTKFFELGSYHHVVIFRCTKEHIESETGKKWKKGKQRGEFVTMIKAAERASRYSRNWKKGDKIKQVVHRNPEQYSLDANCWKFIMNLSNNDLVMWEESDVPWEHKELGKPVYRVQKMSGTGNEITFRHHTVSTTDSGYGMLRKKPNTLRCRKISMDMLGNYKLV